MANHGAMRTILLLLVSTVLAGAGCSPTSPSDRAADFIVDASGERFVLRLTDPTAIQLAEENLAGRNNRFPNGPLRDGDGGFNAPWTWHLDPALTEFVEVAIEICDGRPSYVEEHEEDFERYCPWGARVVGRK